MDHFDVIEAVYAPLRTDDLSPGSSEYNGRIAEWQAVWIIEGGPYDGQWAMAHRG